MKQVTMSVEEYRKHIRLLPTKANKYGNKRTMNEDGTVSDSRKEAEHDIKFMALKRSPLVKCVERKRAFQLVVKDEKICSYVCDWAVEWKDGRLEVYDAKGCKTPVYRIKKKLMKAIYDIEIIEL
jgi:hypothetical protein